MNKTERRHELQQNDLAAYLEKANTRIEPYSKPILGVVLVAMAAGVFWSFYSSEQNADSSFATRRLIQETNVQNVDPENLDQLSTEFPETSAGKLAKLYQGLALVSEGNQDIYTDRETATIALEQGIGVLNTAATNSNEPLIQSRAHLGVALAYVTLGDNAKAIEAYKAVIAANESEAMVENANSRIEILESETSEAFASWFKTANFAVVTPPNAAPSLPPMSGLPDIGLPDIKMPELNLGGGDEASPLGGDAAPRDLDGGLDLPGNAETPAPSDPAPSDPAPAAPSEDAAAEPTAAAKPDQADPSGKSDADTPADTGAEGAATEAPSTDK